MALTTASLGELFNLIY